MDMAKCACSGRSLGRLLQPAVMSVLADEPLHGYLVAQRLQQLAMFEDEQPDFAGLYRVLGGMERQGLLRARWDTAESGPPKRCYELTNPGRQCLAQWLITLRQYRHDIDNLVQHLEKRVDATQASSVLKRIKMPRRRPATLMRDGEKR